MKVLFLGGTGNISAECAALLHERGHEVTVLNRGRIPAPPGWKVLRADRQDPAAMRAVLKGVELEVVVNFLGYEVSDLELDFQLFNRAVRQYVFISSATVYAKPPARLPLSEEMPMGNAWWEYGRKKIACEQWLRQRWEQDRFPATIVRPSHTYSRRWVPNAVSSSSYTFAARLEQGKPVFVHDDGQTPWTLTASSDFALGLAGLLGRDDTLGEAFHITSDEVLTWNRIYAQIAEALGAPPPRIVQVPTDFICQVVPRLTGTLKGDKAHPGVFDNSKIKRFVPDFACRKSFRAGVGESVAWLRAHPDQQNLNPQLDAEIEAVLGAWRGRGSPLT
ncbi:MAG: NAD-dependent epimerase/dehydratase family protein [Limisphaerales bacterium]